MLATKMKAYWVWGMLKGGVVMESAFQLQHTRLRVNSLKKKLESCDFVIGTFLQIPAPQLVELLGLAGFDFLIVDGEHGAMGSIEMENLIRAALSTEISVMVRPANCNACAISQPLDWGAAGIQAPQVDSGEMARQVVRASKYHPLGMRGLQPYVRAASYRACSTDEYLCKANAETLVVVQVEGKEGLADLESISQVEGVDVIFVGPYDLSQSLGVPGQVGHSRVRQTIADTVQLVQNAGKYFGTYCDDVETALEYRKLGVSYLSVSIETKILLAGARSMIARLRNRPPI
jgi:4-hydroxy-2-oxoheptanedioate aldolase